MSFSVVSKTTANPHEGGAPKSRLPVWADLVATACHVGHIKPGPGSWGSAIGVVLWLLTERTAGESWRVLSVFGIAVLLTALGIRASTLVARVTGVEDPPFVIVDEIVGQLFALIGVPVTWKAAVAGFLFFRLFDITKPFPVRRLERLPEGVGIVIDDIAAGLYSLAVLHLLLHFGVLR